MSRSIKKIGCFKIETSCKFGQRRANKKVRQYHSDIPRGGFYKKIFNTWDVCDLKIPEFHNATAVSKRK